MRSLYTDDIRGTRSRLTIFDKSSFKQKYNRFAQSNQKNPQHKKYQWYVPVKAQATTNDYKQPRYTLKLMSQHTGLSKSLHFDQLKKQPQQSIHQKNQNFSVLSSNGRNSIGQLSQRKGIDNSPYFPHRYEDYNQHRVKWSGNRNWEYQKPERLQLPNITKSKLISYI